MTQLTLNITESGSILRDHGISQAIDHADRESPNWSGKALDMLRRYLVEVGGEFQAEEVRQFSVKNGLEEPPHLRAWGGVFVRAKHMGLIHCIGIRPVSTPTSHCANASVWVRA